MDVLWFQHDRKFHELFEEGRRCTGMPESAYRPSRFYNLVQCFLATKSLAGAVAEASRNLSCMGAEPLALTDCLNFGSPENPEVMWQFQQTVEGIREACLALGVPVVSGNVSFYNQTEENPIRPTPVIGMIGSIAAPRRAKSYSTSRS